MTLIRLAFEDNSAVLNLLVDRATEQLFTQPLLGALWKAVAPALEQELIPDPGTLMDQLGSDAERQLLSQILMAAELPGGDDTRAAVDLMSLAIDCLTTLQRETLLAQIEQRRRALQEAEQQAEQPPTEIVSEVAAMQRELASLGDQFDKYRLE